MSKALHPVEIFEQSAKAIAPLIVNMIEPKSVIDFGCGVGYWLYELERLGVDYVRGIDGSYVIEHGLWISEENFIPCDLERLHELKLDRDFDVALCLEVAEHISEDNAPRLVETICDSAKHVVFSAAVPGQTGGGHKNEQYPDYWQSLFKKNGFEMFDFFRPIIWRNKSVEWWYRQNMFLFSKMPSLFKKPASLWDGNIYIAPDLLQLYVSACNSRNEDKYFLFQDLRPKNSVGRKFYGSVRTNLRHLASELRQKIRKGRGRVNWIRQRLTSSRRLLRISRDINDWCHIVPIPRGQLRSELARHCNKRFDSEIENWPVKFLHRYRNSGGADVDALELAIRSTHLPTELQHFLFGVYARHFIDDHAEQVKAFSEFCRGAQLIALHVSCQNNLDLALASVKSFGECQEGLSHVVVIGQSVDSPPCYSFDPSSGILVLPAPDNYEGLSQKMATLFRFLGFGGNSACIMKLDDDVRCANSKFSTSALVKLTRKFDYVGSVHVPARHGVARCWHMGKCQNDEFNLAPFSLVVDHDYLHGPAYFLSPNAINLLAKASVYLCQEFRTHSSYEDAAVGKILKNFGVRPYHYNPFEAGLRSTDTILQAPSIEL